VALKKSTYIKIATQTRTPRFLSACAQVTRKISCFLRNYASRAHAHSSEFLCHWCRWPKSMAIVHAADTDSKDTQQIETCIRITIVYIHHTMHRGQPELHSYFPSFVVYRYEAYPSNPRHVHVLVYFVFAFTYGKNILLFINASPLFCCRHLAHTNGRILCGLTVHIIIK
jgi:hypothetical protein